MKGISAIITIILILLVSISFISLVAYFLNQSQLKLQTGIDSSQAQKIYRDGSCLKIISNSADANYVYIEIENCGKFTLKNFAVYLNEIPAEILYQPEELMPGNKDVIKISKSSGPYMLHGNYIVKITSNYAETMKNIEII